MKTQDNVNNDAKELRQKAEAELKIRKPVKSGLEVDNLKLIHELQVHQIELEMQNEELVAARERAELSMEKYTDLYDFAPSGYLTLSKEGDIVILNFEAARLLGKDRANLKNSHLGLYIHPDSLNHYRVLMDDAFMCKTKKTHELFLLSNGTKQICVQLVAYVPDNANECLLTMTDISARKQLEIDLETTLDHYKKLNSYFLDREMRMMCLKKEINALLIKSGCEPEYLVM
jgi:PAS domain S-box-containing protein